jgi:hypothetical protein
LGDSISLIIEDIEKGGILAEQILWRNSDSLCSDVENGENGGILGVFRGSCVNYHMPNHPADCLMLLKTLAKLF